MNVKIFCSIIFGLSCLLTYQVTLAQYQTGGGLPRLETVDLCATPGPLGSASCCGSENLGCASCRTWECTGCENSGCGYRTSGEPIYLPQQGTVVLDSITPQKRCLSYTGPSTTCPPPPWAHRSNVFGEYLYLKPRDAEVTYAVEGDGTWDGPLRSVQQQAPMGVVDPGYQSAYRAGFWLARNWCTSFGGSYARFSSHSRDSIEGHGQNFIGPMLVNPLINTSKNYSEASARLDIDYQMIDAKARWLAAHGSRFAFNVLAGARYGQLEESFRATYEIQDTAWVDTDLRFSGAGILVGIDGEHYAPNSGFFAYSRAIASFLAGNFRGSLEQKEQVSTGKIDTGWRAGRVVPILELEIGVGWRTLSDRLRLKAGYMFSSWMNMVRTDEFIRAAQTNDFVNLGGNSLTFDGLVAHAEWRF